MNDALLLEQLASSFIDESSTEGFPPSLMELLRPRLLARVRSRMEERQRLKREWRDRTLALANSSEPDSRPNTTTIDALESYDTIVVAFSGGKDSLAALLHILDLLDGDISRLELWHHLVDGDREDSLWDWPVTSAYCQAVATGLGIPLYFSWRDGGFEAEMLRDNQPTGELVTQMPDGSLARTGGHGPPGTRKRFPQLSGDLSVRYCSSYLKIDPCAAAIRLRWSAGKILLVTGERREESGNRARFARAEQHKSSTATRRVDQWRAVLDWNEQQVWERIQRAGLVPHPAYFLGYGRLSCACCIFGGADEWATFRQLRPQQWQQLVTLETTFDRTLKRNETIPALTARGEPFPGVSDEALVRTLNSTRYMGTIRVPRELWQLPIGAFRRSGGPV